jgi:sugar lactone lactonase YvrE
MKKIPTITSIATWMAVIAFAYLLLLPVEISPTGWTPPTMEKQGAPNQALKGIKRIGLNLGVGPEGISFDDAGRIYAGYEDGRIVRFSADGQTHEELANTGGRPWGTFASADGNAVLVADALKGLLRITQGKVEVLSTQSDGVPFKLTDDVVQAASGMIYFSDASSKYGLDKMMADVFEHGNHGRLLSYDPNTRKTTTLASGLHVANGVTLGPDEAYVLVSETLQYRVMRYWLKGPKAGQFEPFVENLPGFPDNISYNGRDGFWLALFAPRDVMLDGILPYPVLLKAVYRIPEALRPKATKHGRVLKLDFNGKVVADLQDATDDAYAPITSVRERGGSLYFGSIEYPSMGKLPLP